MEIKRPLLLISNDDGYQAKGIRQLVEMLSDFDNGFIQELGTHEEEYVPNFDLSGI